MADTSLVFNLVARDRASGVVERMGERMNAASAAIGTGIGAALGVGVATSLSMDGANAKLANQLNLNTAEAARIGKVTGDVFSAGFVPSVDEAALAVRGIGTNMVDVADTSSGELTKLTTQAQVLSDTFEFDLAQSTQAAGALMKSGLAANGTEAFDLITAAAQKLPQEMASEIPLLITEYAGFFKELGVTGPQMMGALTEAAKNPLFELDKLGDAVKEFNLRVADTKAVTDPLKELGLNVADIQAKVNAGKGTQAFDQIVVALSKVKNQTDATRISAALMGGPGEDAKTSLLALGKAGGFASMGMDEAAGSTQKMVDRVANSSTGTLNRFKNTALTKLADVSAGFVNFGMANQGAVVPLLATLGTLAGIVMAVSVAQKLYATYTAIATVATNVMNSATLRAVAGWARMMAVGVMAMLRIAVTSTVSAATTAAAWVGSALVGIGTWIAAVVRAAVTAAAQFLMMAARAVAWAAVMAAQWLIAMGPIGWVIAAVIGLVILIIANWDKVKAATVATWNGIMTAVEAVWNAIKWVVTTQINAVRTTVTNVMNVIRSVIRTVWGWIKTFIGVQVAAVKRVIGGLSSIIGQVRGFFGRMKDAAVDRVRSLLAFVRGIPGKVRGALGDLGGLLVGAGRAIIRGLISGISGMVGALKDKLGGITSIIPDWKGPMSVDLKLLAPSGQALMSGLMTGIDSQLPALHAQLTGVTKSVSADVQPAVSGPAPTNMAPPPVGATNTTIRIEVAGPEEMKRLLRGIVRKDGRGSVQVAFGTGGS